uniref:Methyl farnesoate epoxidase n=1 Tax=Cacopsylla melanoneura TaxID=428564 RepID=A0A8D8PP00_9HEMI
MFLLMEILGLIIAAILFAVWYSAKPAKFPPGPLSLPIFGNSLSIPLYDIHLTLEDWGRRYGPLIGVMMGRQPGLFVTGAGPVVTALKKEEFQGRPDTKYVRERSFGERLGIFFSDGQQWMDSRKITVRYLREFNKGNKLEELIQREIDEFLQERIVMEKPVQMSGFFHHPVLNILWLFLIGRKFSYSDLEYGHFLTSCEESFRLGVLAGSSPTDSFPVLRTLVAKYRTIHSNVFDFIRDVRAMIQKSIVESKPNLSEHCAEDSRYLVEYYLNEMKHNATQTMSENDLTIICLDFIAATINSVNSIIEFCIMYLILHPDVQDKLHAELDEVLGSRKIHLTNDKHRLPYLQAVINETIRINTIAPMTATHRCTQHTDFLGYRIPKDTLIFVSIWSLLYDPSVFPEPHQFNPDRFISSDTKEKEKQTMFLPFGTGKRICPGDQLTKQILLIYLSTLLQSYSVHRVSEDPLPDTRAQAGFVNSPKPFRVILRERN